MRERSQECDCPRLMGLWCEVVRTQLTDKVETPREREATAAGLTVITSTWNEPKRVQLWGTRRPWASSQRPAQLSLQSISKLRLPLLDLFNLWALLSHHTSEVLLGSATPTVSTDSTFHQFSCRSGASVCCAHSSVSPPSKPFSWFRLIYK